MSLLTPLEEFDNFRLIRDVESSSIIAKLREVMRSLDEREEMEPFLRLILADDAQTPHGPAELVDIYTHKLTHKKTSGMAAFILKGKSFKTVRPSDVAHQIYRLEKIEGLSFAVFGSPGTVLDEAKEQFCSTCERLKIRYSFLDANDMARLFVAAGFFCPRDGSRISAGRCKCGYSPQHRFLNLLQHDALEGLKESHQFGNRAGLVVLPPGTGKTRIAAEDAKAFEARRLLYVAHTQEILDVAQSEFEAVFGGAEVQRIESVSFKEPRRIALSTIQLISRSLTCVPVDIFDYVVIDEFHHAAAKTYRALIEHLKPRFLLGLTATPFRGDRQDIWKLCGEHTIRNYDLRSAIEAGVLVPYHYFGCFDDVDYAAIQTDAGLYSVKDLERALTIPERDAAIIEKWRSRANGVPTLAFCCSIKHATRVALSFQAAGINAASYTSALSREERNKLLDRFKAGTLTVLSVVDVFNEGADLPFVECLLFLRPTDSKRIFFQQLGRGLRRYHGKALCTVIDFIGNFRNAYKIVEYQGLLPIEEDDSVLNQRTPQSAKSLLNLPLGCEVHFDDRVIDLFATQALNPTYATRHNIGRILIYQYQKMEKRLGRPPKKVEIDRQSRLSSDLYGLFFGSWKKFQKIMDGLKAI